MSAVETGRPRLSRPLLSANALIVLVALFLVLIANARVWSILSRANVGAGTFMAVGVALTALTAVILAAGSVRGVFKPWLVLVLLMSAAASHFSGRFGAVIDRHAVASVFGSDAREAAEWLSVQLGLDLLLVGVVPSALVLWTRVVWRSRVRETLLRLALIVACVALLGATVLAQGRQLASLLRNHMELRHVANPYALASATLSYARHRQEESRPPLLLGVDARHAARAPGDAPTVIVVVVGESARAASFGLDGYGRDTTPELRRLQPYNFRNVSSCGTNTATSLPCMFSILGRAHYEESAARQSENVLDVLRHGGFDVLWLDNNTGSKELAARGREVALAAAHEPAFCHEDGCWDGILVEHLETVLPTIQRDTVIVLHMLGSHGPAYYQRYPPAFARFKPECRVNELQQCSRVQIVNTYDNTIAYTDHVVAGAVRALQAAPRLDSLLWFVSDHGESTGESNLYLHGAPYVIAPEEQTHVPMLLWTSEHFEARHGVDHACIRARAGAPLSHDNLSHTLMGLAQVSTSIYRRDLDLVSGCLRAAP